jgi:hypothetical protein
MARPLSQLATKVYFIEGQIRNKHTRIDNAKKKIKRNTGGWEKKYRMNK